jgi:hypothetical protein
MGKLTTLFAFLLLSTASLFAQSNTVKAIDSIYIESLRAVRFNTAGNPFGTPIMDLKTGRLGLSFDDMEVDIRDMLYSIEQCDRNWQPSKLDRLEYIEGLQEDRITQYKSSYTTNIPYMHYSLAIPTESMRITKSGNYILKVFEDNAEKSLVLTRRFVVYEQIVVPIPTMTFSVPTKYNTHHELDVNIEPKQFRIQNPMNDIRLTIMQNGRWDNAYYGVKPAYVQGDRIVFDYQDAIVFPAGKEWRYVDLRSSRFRSERVQSINKGDQTWDFLLRTDLDRGREPYILYPDINGQFYIETTDYDGSSESYIRADYVNAQFSLLKKTPIEDADIYIYGGLTDWKIDDRFKLEYDYGTNMYEADVLLKQGFYNYAYAIVPKNKKSVDIATLEGDWYEAENEYTILVHFTPFGGRHDRVIGFYTFKSSKR